MDTVTTQKTKSRKIKRLAKKSRAQIILDLFYRAIEIVLVLVTVAKLCYQLVITLHDSGAAAVILANRSLAFVVANAIVIALVAKSGLLLNHEAVPKSQSNALYEEFVQENSRRDEVLRPEIKNRGKQSEAENKAKQSITETRAKQSEAEEEKQSITETISKQSISEKRETRSKPEKSTKQRTSAKREKQSIVEHQETTAKKMEKQKRQSQSYQRSGSENLEGLEKSSCERLRRSETDASSDRFDSEDELRFKIESFIARQRRNQNDD